MSLCYYREVWGPFQLKFGTVSYHRRLITLECLFSFKMVITVLGVPSVNKVLTYKRVHACVFSGFDTQIHPYVRL